LSLRVEVKADMAPERAERDRLLARAEQAEAQAGVFRAGRDWQYEMAVKWRNRCVGAEAERDRLLAVAEAARDPFLVLLESHPDADGHANAEMARAAKRLRAALAALEEK
jgi:hypothetical protein